MSLRAELIERIAEANQARIWGSFRMKISEETERVTKEQERSRIACDIDEIAAFMAERGIGIEDLKA